MESCYPTAMPLPSGCVEPRKLGLTKRICLSGGFSRPVLALKPMVEILGWT